MSIAERGLLRIDFTHVTPSFADVARRLGNNGYPPVPLVWGHKRPSILEWQNYSYQSGDEFRYMHCGVGILCGDVVGVDVDIFNSDAATEVRALAREMLGPAPVRIGAAPKSLLLYRVEGDPFPKLVTAGYRLPGDSQEDKPHRVEILASGQQFVAFNIHPDTGRPYKWEDGRGPMNVRRSKLTAVTHSQVEAFIVAANELLARHGERVGKRAEAEAADREHKPSAELRAAEPAVLRDALSFIPNDDDGYDDWIGMCYAIKGALGEEGLPEWLKWSAQSMKDVPATTDRAWKSAKPIRVGAGSIYRHATENGWVRPRSSNTEWPEPLHADAYHGPLGAIARAIEPDTESDPAAILIQSLAVFGACVGRGPHVRVEGDQHPAQLFVLVVGKTSRARKGTSFGRVREAFGEATLPEIAEGLSSGEGLKFHLRDATEKDAGAGDKRLLVRESEFAQVLRQTARDGNTLSAVIRCAFDSGDLQSLTRKDPIIATGTHVTIIGHITKEELERELTATDQFNGFANRFLFVCAKRSKSLPLGGKPLDDEVRERFSKRLRRAIEKAMTLRAIDITPEARSLWVSEYPRLSADVPGLLGSVTARAEALVLRIALIYALADESCSIDLPHLRAALAVWQYCFDSAAYLFGKKLGDPLADELLRALRTAGTAGMTRTQIRDHFGRHVKSERIDAVLELLARRKLAVEDQPAPTGGRPTEAWRAVS
jgi:hypothetical protein